MLYFAYGMNTNSSVMSSTSKRLGPAMLLDYKWEMLQFANVVAIPGVTTLGVLWEIDEVELQDLDIREGYPSFYNRVLTEVEHNGELVQSWVYYMMPEYRVKLANEKPSQHYYESVVEGYEQDGLIIPG